MAVLPIVTAPDPVLKKKAEQVPEVNDDIKALLSDMAETMYAAKGIGLAAPQVGVSLRVIVVDVDQDDRGAEGKLYKMVNPEIIWSSDEIKSYQEGCLSLPDQYEDVERPAEVTLKYLDETGKKEEMKVSGLLGICIQHEIDHLNGTLFVDHLGSVKRRMILEKLKKEKKKLARQKKDG